MGYVKPADILKTMAKTGTNKALLSVKDLLIRGSLSGALLGIATSLALTSNLPIVGAFIFPVGFVIIVLLELVTGSFALVPLAARQGEVPLSRVISNGNLAGSLCYALLLYCVLRMTAQL